MKGFQKFNGRKRGKKDERKSTLIVSSCKMGGTGEMEHPTVKAPRVTEILYSSAGRRSLRKGKNTLLLPN